MIASRTANPDVAQVGDGRRWRAGGDVDGAREYRGMSYRAPIEIDAGGRRLMFTDSAGDRWMARRMLGGRRPLVTAAVVVAAVVVIRLALRSDE